MKQFTIAGRKHDGRPFLSSSLVPLQNDPFCFLLFVLGNQKGGGKEGPTLLLLLGPSWWSWIIFLMQFCNRVSIAAICVVYIAASCTVCPWWSRASLNNRKDAKVFLCICLHLPAQNPHTHYSFVSWRSLVLITCKPSTILILKPFLSSGTQLLILPTRGSLLNIKTFCALHRGRRPAIPGTLHFGAYILRLWPSN